MALVHQGATFFHVFAVLLGIALLVAFAFFVWLTMRRFKSFSDNLKFLIAAAVRKRREMATYGVKPNPPFFRSQLRKKHDRTLKAEVYQKRKASYWTILGYSLVIYDPVICSIHRCRKQKKRKIIKTPPLADATSTRALPESNEQDLPVLHTPVLNKEQLKQHANSNELIQQNSLAPGRWFILLQYMGGLFILWFFVLFWLAVFYIADRYSSSSVGVFIGIALLSALFASAAIIGFYWYTYRLYVTHVKQTFAKGFYTMLGEPLSKPRPTVGGHNQTMNLYALGPSLYHSQPKLTKSLDINIFRRQYASQPEKPIISPLPLRGYLSQDRQPGVSPMTTERGVLLQREIAQRQAEQYLETPYRNQENGSGGNLLVNASMDRLMRRDRDQDGIRSDFDGTFTKGEFAQIRRTQQERKTKSLMRGFIFLLAIALLLLLAGISALAMFYAPTALAVGTFVSFIFGGAFEIFLVRPLYLLIIALIRKCILKKKQRHMDYHALDRKQRPLDNADLMDEANFFAAELELRKSMLGSMEEEGVYVRDQMGYDGISPSRNDITSGVLLPSPEKRVQEFVEPDRKYSSLQKRQSGRKSLIQEEEEAPSPQWQSKRASLIKPDPEEQGEQTPEKPSTPNPEEDLDREVEIDERMPPESPFGANMSGIPKKLIASFERDGDEPSFDRAAHILVTPQGEKNTLRKQNGLRQQAGAVNLERSLDGIPGRKVDPKNQSLMSSGLFEDALNSPVVLGAKAQQQAISPGKGPVPLRQTGKIVRPVLEKSLAMKRTAKAGKGEGSGQGHVQNDLSGEFNGPDRIPEENLGGIEAVSDARDQIPPFIAGRHKSGHPSILEGLPEDGEIDQKDLPEEADLSQMLMNPLDDLCPYKKLMTDVIYLSCGPEGGDQILSRLSKPRSSVDSIPLEELSRIVQRNQYEINPAVPTEVDENGVPLRAMIPAVIPIEETPMEDEDSSGSYPLSVENQNSTSKNSPKQSPRKKEEDLTDSQIIAQEMENLATNRAPNVDMSFTGQHSLEQIDQQLFSVQKAAGEKQGNLSARNTSKRQSPNTSLSHKGKSPRLSDKGKRAGDRSLLSSGKRSPGASGSKKNSPSIPSSRKSPMKGASPRKILMGAGMAPNSKAQGGRGAGKDRSLDLDLANMTGTIIMSAESGGRTPPGMQGAEPFFMMGPESAEDDSSRMRKSKRHKNTPSPLRNMKISSNSKKHPKVRGILASRSPEEMIEYEQGNHENSLEIDPSSVYFKHGEGLPHNMASDSEESFSEGDMVYYNKEDLTNYSRHLGLNKLHGAGYRFKKMRRNSLHRHSFQADRFSELSFDDSQKKLSRMHRSVSQSVSGRPLAFNRSLRPSRRHGYQMYGSKRVDCWNPKYEIQRHISRAMIKKKKKRKSHRKGPRSQKYQSDQDGMTPGAAFQAGRDLSTHNSSFKSGGPHFDQMDGDRRMTSLDLDNTRSRDFKRGYLPPMNRQGGRKKKKTKRTGSRMFSPASTGMWGASLTKGSDQLRNFKPSTEHTRANSTSQSVLKRRGSDLQHSISTALRPKASRHTSMQYSEDESSPYAERMVARFKSWYPGKEDKNKKRRDFNQVKVGMLESLYGGPVQITGIGICGGIRPSQRKKWLKHHKLIQLQRSQLMYDEANDSMHPSALGKRQLSNRSNRSSLQAFPEQPEASFNPNFYKYYESDGYSSGGGPPASGSGYSNRFKFNNSLMSPQPRSSSQPRRNFLHQKSSFDQSNVSQSILPDLPPNGRVMRTAKNSAKKHHHQSLFNPESADQKWTNQARPQFQSPSRLERSDDPIENESSPVNFGTPGDTVMIESGQKVMHPRKGNVPTLPPLPRKAPQAPSEGGQSDVVPVEDF